MELPRSLVVDDRVPVDRFRGFGEEALAGPEFWGGRRSVADPVAVVRASKIVPECIPMLAIVDERAGEISSFSIWSSFGELVAVDRRTRKPKTRPIEPCKLFRD